MKGISMMIELNVCLLPSTIDFVTQIIISLRRTTEITLPVWCMYDQFDGFFSMNIALSLIKRSNITIIINLYWIVFVELEVALYMLHSFDFVLEALGRKSYIDLHMPVES